MALSWFLKAADQGITWAQVWAADFYVSGSDGIERDVKKALALHGLGQTAGALEILTPLTATVGDSLSTHANAYIALAVIRSGNANDPTS